MLAGVKVALTGAATADGTTDASGYFEFAGVASGAYVVTPALDGYTFGPAELAVAVPPAADVAGVNFTASASPPATYTVSGAVTFSGAALAGVKITLQGATTAVTTTDATGAYRFLGVAAGEYLIIPFHDDYTFSTASRFVVVSTANVTAQNFAAAVSPSTRTISGTVAGAATAGVTMTLVDPSPASTIRVVTTTDGAGSFAFRGLADGLYVVTPSLAGFAFTPANCLVTVAGPSVSSIQFTSAFAPHSISGRVTGPSAAGVSVSLSGGATLTTTTDGSGNYSFPALPNGDYTVRPSRSGYYFSPVEAAVTLAGANATGVDFVSAASHFIAGHVSGDVLAGVKITLAGAAGAEATTDPTGIYTFADLRDGAYVLTPALAGYTFDPLQVSTDLAGADLRVNFTSTRIPTYTASGTILLSGAGQGGVTVSLSGVATLTGDPTSTTATTDPSGVYSFTALPNGSYMVIPALDGYAFTPASRAFRIDGADVAGQDFTSAAAP